MKQIVLVFIITIFNQITCQNPCTDPLSIYDCTNPLIPIFVGCQPNAVRPTNRNLCQCLSHFYEDPNEPNNQRCQLCHESCQHLTCVGKEKSDCTQWDIAIGKDKDKEVAEGQYHQLNLFSTLGQPTTPNIRGKNTANFQMNNVCTGVMFDTLVIHMIGVNRGQTFDQLSEFASPPIMQSAPHVLVATPPTKCIIGPGQRLIYAGQTIINRFIYSLQDTQAKIL